MKKRIIILLAFCLILTGCGNSNSNNSGGNGLSNDDNGKVVGKYYPSIMVKSNNPDMFYLSISNVIGDMSVVSHGEDYYYPTLILNYNNQGKLDNFSVIGYFLDNKDDYEWADKSLEVYKESTAKVKKSVTSTTKGRVNDFVSYVKYNFKYDKDNFYYNFNQFIDSDLIYKQDIEEFKNDTCYSRFDNYDTEPKHIDEDKHFYCSLEDLNVYWSTEKNAFGVEK